MGRAGPITTQAAPKTAISVAMPITVSNVLISPARSISGT